MSTVHKALRIVIVLVLTIAMISTNCVFANGNNNTTVDVDCINEYEYICALQDADEKELESIGMSRLDADSIVSRFYSTLRERAQLPKEKLLKMDYSEEAIALLYRYANGEMLTRGEMGIMSATCTGTITSSALTSKRCWFIYHWNWSQFPVIDLTDLVAIRWAAMNSYGIFFDTDLESVSCDVFYNYNGTVYHTGHGTIDTSSLSFCTTGYHFNMLYPVYESYNEETETIDYAYAKTGDVHCLIYANNTSTIGYVKVGAVYGHQVLPINLSISISISGDISIDITPSGAVSETGKKKVRIDPGPIVTELN